MHASSPRALTVVGVPIDSLGTPGGTERAPAALRRAGIVAELGARDAGDLAVRLAGTAVIVGRASSRSRAADTGAGIALLAHRDSDEARSLRTVMPDEIGIGSSRDCADVQRSGPGRVGRTRPNGSAPTAAGSGSRSTLTC
jgi:hypothetical protein